MDYLKTTLCDRQGDKELNPGPALVMFDVSGGIYLEVPFDWVDRILVI
jgi:hypothetical protein